MSLTRWGSHTEHAYSRRERKRSSGKMKLLLGIVVVISLGTVHSKKDAEDNNLKFIKDEISTLEKITKCNVKILSRKSVQALWLHDKAGDGTTLCLLKELSTTVDDAFLWSLTGSSFDARGAHRKADFCFKQSSKLSGKHSKYIKEWSYLAPFPIGKSEFDGDPVEAYGGISNSSKFRFDSKSVPTFDSELVSNGIVKWSEVKVSQVDDVVQVKPLVDWNDLVSSLGSLGITEWQGWAVGDLVVSENDLPLVFQCLGVARCFVGETMLIGDLYHRDLFWSPVSLSRGVHPIYIPLRGRVAVNFKFSIASKFSKFHVSKAPFSPDIYDGFIPRKIYVPVLVSNRMSEDWLTVKKVEIVNQFEGREIQAKLETHFALTAIPVAPGQTRYVNVQLFMPDVSGDYENIRLVDGCQDLTFDLKLKTSHGAASLKLSLRCRTRGSSFLFTFIDRDGSVQHAAAIEPLGVCTGPGNSCPVVLSLHGTTVPPQNQADSYKKMVDGKFEFGVHGMWLLAPTRHGAHNWEGPGASTAMAALDALRKISEDRAMFKFSADSDHILFAGHSMGGHGAWHLATIYPDRAIGLVSLAGWIRKEEYGDSNLFFRHDVSTSYVEPSLKAIMESAVAGNDVDKHISNLKGIPILARIGSNDRTVHPYFVRKMVRVLRAADLDVTYSEVPGLEHWWWDTKETNDGGCVNDLQIRDFFDKILKGLNSAENPSDSVETCSAEDVEGCASSLWHEDKPEAVTLTVFNANLGATLKGVKVVHQWVPFRKSTLEMHRQGDSVWIKTNNVREFGIFNVAANRPWDWDEIFFLKIDGFKQNRPFMGRTFWQNEQSEMWGSSKGLVEPYGSIKGLVEGIVIGTQGDSSTTSLLLQHGVYIANQFLATFDSSVSIIKDTEYSLDLLRFYSGDYIIIGRPDENAVSHRYLDLMKFDITPSSVKLKGHCVHDAGRTGVLIQYPGYNPSTQLMMGLSREGLADVINLATPTIPPMARAPFSNLLPDFVITGPDTGLKGPGGFLCAGFLDQDNRYFPELSSCVC